MSISPLVSSVIEYFVHPGLSADRDQHHRASILSAVMLTFVLLSLLACLLTVVSSIPMKYSTIICLSAAACLIGLLMVLRRKGAFMLCSIGAVFVTLLAMVFGIVVSGGPDESPSVQLLVLPPLMAHFFGGRRWGRNTVGVTFLCLAVLYGLNFAGFTFIQSVGVEQHMNLARMIVTLVNFGAVSALAYIYEVTSSALKQERDAEHERYIQLAKTDPLTGLSNRRNFDALLERRLAAGRQSKPPRCFALGYLDLDGFKPINDQYGHAVGDEVLCVVSERLRGALREADFVGRHGGDEFMLCLDTVEDMSVVEAAAQRVLASIAAPIVTTAGAVKLSGSLGFALYPQDALDIEGLKKSADAAMYEAKREHDAWRLARRAA